MSIILVDSVKSVSDNILNYTDLSFETCINELLTPYHSRWEVAKIVLSIFVKPFIFISAAVVGLTASVAFLFFAVYNNLQGEHDVYQENASDSLLTLGIAMVCIAQVVITPIFHLLSLITKTIASALEIIAEILAPIEHLEISVSSSLK